MHFRASLTMVLLATVAVSAVALAQAPKAKSASAAVEEYIRAASDSNLKRMAELLGTDKGSAARVGLKAGYVQQRMIIAQTYLAHISVRALSEIKGTKSNERVVTAELTRNGCKVVIPVTAVLSNQDGWLVRNLDLDQVKFPCPAGGGNSGG